eukprot:TRINITY_DN3071_c0_g1_i1.p2 TRINITY_DN3071_c0_g1~~TRINITY_DN3071_c0_g1_i1.p2  ORF type:complete len:100 (+),score=26.21 TRINITY_DN3071_c0_g1_i1:66-365(+)
MCIRDRVSTQSTWGENKAFISEMSQIIGAGAIGAGAFIFTYYTAWVFIAPYLSAKNPLKELFLGQDIAFFLPVVLLVLGLAFIGAFFFYVSNKKKNKAK